MLVFFIFEKNKIEMTNRNVKYNKNNWYEQIYKDIMINESHIFINYIYMQISSKKINVQERKKCVHKMKDLS